MAGLLQHLTPITFAHEMKFYFWGIKSFYFDNDLHHTNNVLKDVFFIFLHDYGTNMPSIKWKQASIKWKSKVCAFLCLFVFIFVFNIFNYVFNLITINQSSFGLRCERIDSIYSSFTWLFLHKNGENVVWSFLHTYTKEYTIKK